MSQEKEQSAGADPVAQDRELQNVRASCMRAARSAVAACPGILSDADIRAYEHEVISDQALAISGIVSHEAKIHHIREVERTYIPQLVLKSRILEMKFSSQIETAEREGWINKQSANRWLKRLGENIVYYKKKKFIEEDMQKFPTYVANWKRVAEERKKLLKHPQMKMLKTEDVNQLSAFVNEKQFLNLSFEAREALLSNVNAALHAKTKQMPQLYAKAKSMLDAAVRKQALSPGKVGTWLERIFKSNAKPELLEKFLNNEGSMPLQRLIDNWSDASKHFQTLEAKRKSLGSPRGFQFVKMNVFLNWQYDKRKAYLNEAEHRFVDISQKPYTFLQIQHELGAKDWDAADELIEEAKKEEWGTENQAKLRSMEQFLRQHRTDGKQGLKQKEQHPSPKEMIAEMDGLIAQLPSQLQQTYKNALNKGPQAFWVLTTLMYNRVWCYQHHFLDPKKEAEMKTNSKDKTRIRMKQGHAKRGTEVNDLRGSDTNEHPAVRDQEGIKSAQILLTDERSSETLVDEINEQKNDRNFWYWTSMIPEGVPYSLHANIVQTLHPRMKKLARMMEKAGASYSLSSIKSEAAVSN